MIPALDVEQLAEPHHERSVCQTNSTLLPGTMKRASKKPYPHPAYRQHLVYRLMKRITSSVLIPLPWECNSWVAHH
jgi:hypothetical protein